MSNSRPDAKRGFMNDLVQLWPTTSSSDLLLYRTPGTDICRLCPVGADWGGGRDSDGLAAWPPHDRRWRWLTQVCDESEPGRIKKPVAGDVADAPQCPLAKVYWWLGCTWSSVIEGQAVLHRAEEIARQTLDPTRPASLAYFERALRVERDRRDFVAQMARQQAVEEVAA